MTASPTFARLGAAAGTCGACSAAGAGDWLAFVAFAVPALGFALLLVAERRAVGRVRAGAWHIQGNTFGSVPPAQEPHR